MLEVPPEIAEWELGIATSPQNCAKIGYVWRKGIYFSSEITFAEARNIESIRHSYEKQRLMIDATFEKNDTNHSNMLEVPL